MIAPRSAAKLKSCRSAFRNAALAPEVQQLGRNATFGSSGTRNEPQMRTIVSPAFICVGVPNRRYGDERWGILRWIPHSTTFIPGMKVDCSAPSARSIRIGCGRYVSGAISIAACATERYSTSPSTANFAAATWSRYALLTSSPVIASGIAQDKAKRPRQFELVEPPRKSLLARLK